MSTAISNRVELCIRWIAIKCMANSTAFVFTVIITSVTPSTLNTIEVRISVRYMEALFTTGSCIDNWKESRDWAVINETIVRSWAKVDLSVKVDIKVVDTL